MPEVQQESSVHEKWMAEAQLMVRLHIRSHVRANFSGFTDKGFFSVERQAEEAMAAREVPVGCVFVRDGAIIARARNRTNELRNVCRIYLPFCAYTHTHYYPSHLTLKLFLYVGNTPRRA